jgi:hypothetical protein
MRLSKLKGLAAAAASMGALALAGPSHAVALVAGSGWQEDVVNAAGSLSDNSPVTFTVGAGGSDIFSLSDAFTPGDIYTVTVNGAVTAMSTFTSYATSFDNNLGPAAATFAPAWLDNSFSHLQLIFAPGTYSLSITGDCAGTCPAHFGDRLDVAAIPEPAVWASMLVGFGLLGGVIRRDRRRRTRRAFA